MKERRHIAIFTLAALTAALTLLSGCADISDIDLPTLPPLPVESAQVTPTTASLPAPSATPVVTAAEANKPSPVPFPMPTAPQAVTEEAGATPAPSPTPDSLTFSDPSPVPVETEDPEYQISLDVPTASEVYYQTPFLTISGETLPADMAQYNVAILHGTVSTDCGIITQVVGLLINSAGETVQECSFYPDETEFSLAGTVNSKLRFATLSPDVYRYQLSARGENGEASAEYVLIDHVFTVSETAPKKNATGNVQYSARLTDDSSNAGYIWNFFIGQFNNPCAAAAILGNIDIESGCIPTRVEGDLSSDFAFSNSYTALVDDGSVTRASFISAKPGDKYGHGYGLCQWTGDRKGTLYDLAELRGSSVGELSVQCELIMLELCSNYPKLYDYLLTADNAEAAALEFCNVYEQAAIRGSRAALAQEYLDKYGV